MCEGRDLKLSMQDFIQPCEAVTRASLISQGKGERERLRDFSRITQLARGRGLSFLILSIGIHLCPFAGAVFIKTSLVAQPVKSLPAMQ